MRQIVKRGSFGCHNDACEQSVFRMHMGASFNRRDHWHTYVGKVLHNLNAFIVNLTPNPRIGDIAKRRKIDTGYELPARASQDHDFVRAILRDPIESIDEFRVILSREG